MYYIIENKDQINYLKENIDEDSKCFINIITFNDQYHNKLTSPCLVYFKPLNDKGYIICIDHSESFSIDFQEVIELLSKYDYIYLLDRKKHLYFLPKTLNLIDLNFDKLELDNTIFDLSGCETPVHTYFYIKHGFDYNINRIIPISKHFEKQEQIFDIVKDIIPVALNRFGEYVDNFFDIEKQGISLNMVKFKENFNPTHPQYSIKNNKIYGCYNLYNLTTRPTNHFNNINFSAMNKKDNTRAAIIPENDMLVEFDFDGCHPRIIATLTGVKFSAKSAHMQLATMYYNVPVPTQDQIDSAKKLTFKQLYGGIEDRYKNIEFFKRASNFADAEWNKYLDNKTKLFGGRRLLSESESMSHNSVGMDKAKLLNYLVQSYETYNNVKIISKLLQFLNGKRSKLIMYSYDAFLFDISKSEGTEVLKGIKNILEEQFPVKITYGSNYKTMVKL